MSETSQNDLKELGRRAENKQRKLDFQNINTNLKIWYRRSREKLCRIRNLLIIRISIQAQNAHRTLQAPCLASFSPLSYSWLSLGQVASEHKLFFWTWVAILIVCLTLSKNKFLKTFLIKTQTSLWFKFPRIASVALLSCSSPLVQSEWLIQRQIQSFQGKTPVPTTIESFYDISSRWVPKNGKRVYQNPPITKKQCDNAQLCTNHHTHMVDIPHLWEDVRWHSPTTCPYRAEFSHAEP